MLCIDVFQSYNEPLKMNFRNDKVGFEFVGLVVMGFFRIIMTLRSLMGETMNIRLSRRRSSRKTVQEMGIEISIKIRNSKEDLRRSSNKMELQNLIENLIRRLRETVTL